MTEATVKLDERGRLEVPTEFLEALGLRSGAALLMRLAPNGLQVEAMQPTPLEEAQRLVRTHVDADRSLVDELISERRRASKDE